VKGMLLNFVVALLVLTCSDLTESDQQD